MKSIFVFLCLLIAQPTNAAECNHLAKVEFLCIVAEEDLVQAYRKEVFDIAYYHGRADAMATAAFQIQQSTGPCQCVDILTKLADKAEHTLDYVERYSHWSGDTWYWMGAFNAYNEILEAIDP